MREKITYVVSRKCIHKQESNFCFFPNDGNNCPYQVKYWFIKLRIASLNKAKKRKFQRTLICWQKYWGAVNSLYNALLLTFLFCAVWAPKKGRTRCTPEQPHNAADNRRYRGSSGPLPVLNNIADVQNDGIFSTAIIVARGPTRQWFVQFWIVCCCHFFFLPSSH